MSGRVVPCTQGYRWGTGARGAVQASAQVVETIDGPTTGADPVQLGLGPAAIRVAVFRSGRSRSSASSSGLPSSPRWRGPQPVQRRVLVAGGRPMDAGAPRLHGPRPLQLYGNPPPLGDRRVGVGDHGGRIVQRLRERAYSIYAIVLGGLCLVASAAYARALGARGGRVLAIVILLAVGIAGIVAGDRGLDFSLVWLPLELLLLTKARPIPLAAPPAPSLPPLGQHPLGRSCSASSCSGSSSVGR